jgi:hypothetical protein
MKKKITRRQVDAWLAPMRRALIGMRESGCCDSIRGYAVTRLHHADDYARVDFCLAGFRGLLERLFPGLDSAPLLRVESRLANGVPLTVAEIDAALSLLKSLEKPLMGKTADEVTSAVRTEQIQIELDAIREAA